MKGVEGDGEDECEADGFGEGPEEAANDQEGEDECPDEEGEGDVARADSGNPLVSDCRGGVQGGR